MTMNYLDAFTVGSSAPCWLLHLVTLLFKDPGAYSYSLTGYSFVAPVYYGLMSALALYLGRTFKLDLRTRLLVVSVISIVLVRLVQLIASFVGRSPYPNHSRKEWIRYSIDNAVRHLVNFNVIMYFLTEEYDRNRWWRAFTIGSSALMTLVSYAAVAASKAMGGVMYDYGTFALSQPLILGTTLAAILYLLEVAGGLSLKKSLAWYVVITTSITYVIADKMGAYRQSAFRKPVYLLTLLVFAVYRAVVAYALLRK